MDEVYRWIRFENVAPGPFAGMRLARDQQSAQSIAHSVDHQRGAVVVLRQLLRSGLGLELDDVRPAMVDRHFYALRAANRQGELARLAAILAQGDARPRAGRGRRSEIVDPHRDLNGLADEAEARRLLDEEAAIDLARLAREQHVERRGEVEMIGRRHVVDLAVGDHDDAGETLARYVRERAVECGEELRAGS